MAEDLNSGRPRTNPASGQSGTRTRDRRIACHSVTLTPFLKRLRLRVGALLSNCTMGLFCRGYFFFYWLSRGWGGAGCVEIRAKHSHSAVCHNSLSSLLHRPFERQRVTKQAKRDASWERASHQLLVRLSKDVFERRTSTGRGLFSFFDGEFAQKFWANRLYNSKDT